MQTDIEKMIFHYKTIAIDTGENLQKSIKTDVSDANGHRKHDFHEKTSRCMPNENSQR